MFHGLNPGVERLGIVVVEDIDGGLSEDRPVVDQLVDDVNGDTRQLHSVSQRFLHGMGAWERRQQRWVDVHDASRETLNGFGCEDAHEAGQDHEGAAVCFDGIAHRGGECIAIGERLPVDHVG